MSCEPHTCNRCFSFLMQITNCRDCTVTVNVQDPSGSIGAGIHVDALQTEEGVSPGAVLMLEQVLLSLCPKYSFRCAVVQVCCNCFNTVMCALPF